MTALRPALQDIGVECRLRPQTDLSRELVAELETYMHGDRPKGQTTSLFDIENDFDDDEDEFSGLPFDRRAMEGDMAHWVADLGESVLDAKTSDLPRAGISGC